MSVNFITLSNGVITGQHFGDLNADLFNTPYYGHERLQIPPTARVREYDKLVFYDDDWTRKSNIQLIDEGLIPMPEGYVREGDELRKMTDEERILAGLDELWPGTKIVNGKIIPMTQMERIEAGLEEMPNGFKCGPNGEAIPMTQIERINAGIETLPKGMKIVGNELMPMTMDERLEAEQITQTEFDDIIKDKNENELSLRLSELQTPEVLAQAEIDDEYAAERKAKLIALLAVKKQPGWPLEVVWPV